MYHAVHGGARYAEVPHPEELLARPDTFDGRSSILAGHPNQWILSLIAQSHDGIDASRVPRRNQRSQQNRRGQSQSPQGH